MKGDARRKDIIKRRILTGVVALPLLILFIRYTNATLFNVLVYGVTFLALVEFYAMSLPSGRIPERVLAVAGGTFLVPLLCLKQPVLAHGAVTLLVFFFVILFLFRFRDLSTVAQQLAMILFGFLYIPLLLSHLVLLRSLPFGREWVFLVLLIVMAGDTMAYFTGVSLGQRRLCPAISPNKSVEGAIGGLAGSLAGAFLARVWFFPCLAIHDCFLLGLILGVLGQLGDLFESMLKRSFGVKDSGTMIPGHGGILDRLDSLLFAFPAAYYYGLLLFAGVEINR
jgi:phosphatidate cytidylyltransferase